MGSRTPDNRPWGSEKVRGMIAAGRWSDAQIARYVGTHTESQVASIRRDMSEERLPTCYPAKTRPGNFGTLELENRRAKYAAQNDNFIARLRKLGVRYG